MRRCSSVEAVCASSALTLSRASLPYMRSRYISSLRVAPLEHSHVTREWKNSRVKMKILPMRTVVSLGTQGRLRRCSELSWESFLDKRSEPMSNSSSCGKAQTMRRKSAKLLGEDADN